MGAGVPIQLWGGFPVQSGRGSLCGLRVPKQFRGIPVQFGAGFGGVPMWFGVPGSLGVLGRSGASLCSLGGSLVWFGGPCMVWSVPGVVWGPEPLRWSLGVSGSAAGQRGGGALEPSPPAGVAITAGGGGGAGPGASRLFRRRVVSAAATAGEDPALVRSRSRSRRGLARPGSARPVPAMWFIYVLSWLSLLIQVAFVTLAIGEPAAGGRELRGVSPRWVRAAGSFPRGCRDMS